MKCIYKFSFACGWFYEQYNYLNGVSYVCNKMQIRKTEIMVVGFVGE